MRDPCTVAFTIRYPWRAYWPFYRNEWERNYRAPFITIWHVDPETDGTADSCGWFKRARHGDNKVRKDIEEYFRLHGDAEYGGWFNADGTPRLSPIGIAVDMMMATALYHFGGDWRKRDRFMRRYLFEIVNFAENNVDTLHDSITGRYGIEKDREQRIKNHAAICYGWVLRKDQRWWQHPRWHFWHWRLEIHPLQKLRRWLFSRCAYCGKRFKWGYCPTSIGWHIPKRRWLQGEAGLYHSECSAAASATAISDAANSADAGGYEHA